MDQVQVIDEQLPFIMLEKHVLMDTDIKANDMMVYLVLKSYANWNTGESFPSIKTLCKETKLTDKTLKKSIDKLIELGYISINKIPREDGGFFRNIYTIRRISDIIRKNSDELTGDIPTTLSENFRTNYINNNYNKNNNIVQQADEDVKKPKKKNTYSEEFEQLWSIYPKKRNKPKAYQCYKEALAKHHSHEVIFFGVECYANECRKKNTEIGYIKMLEGFLNDGRYLEYRRVEQQKEKKVEELSLF